MPNHVRRAGRPLSRVAAAVICGLLLVAGGALPALPAIADPTPAVANPAVANPTPAVAAEPVGGRLLGGTAVVVSPGAAALPKAITASSWVVADGDTGEILAARNPHGRFAPASTLKILTALTLLPRLSSRRVVRVTNAEEMVDGTKVGLVPGSSVRVDQLFTALLVVSANDAADVLADADGGLPVTLGRMRAEAHRLQASDTVPRTVHGLDVAGQTSSAYDLALMGRAGLAMPSFRHYVAIRTARMPAPHGKTFQITTHDKLLTHFPGALGVKNGYTDAARASFVGAARRGGRTLIVALMHADPLVWKEAAALLTWGFAADGRVTPVGRLVAPLPPAAISGATSAARGAAPATRRHAGPASFLLPALAIGALLALLVWIAIRRLGRARTAESPDPG